MLCFLRAADLCCELKSVHMQSQGTQSEQMEPSGTAPGCDFAAIPHGDGSWAFVDAVRAADWNMPPTAAEISSVMQAAQRPAHRSAEDRMANMEKQMNIMMRMMLKLMQQHSNSSSPCLSGNSTPASQGSGGSVRAGPPQVFRCPACNAGPMTEKSFYKHIGQLSSATVHHKCHLEEGHVLLDTFEGTHADRVLALCKSLQKLVTPGANSAHSLCGTGNELRVEGYVAQLRKRPFGE